MRRTTIPALALLAAIALAAPANAAVEVTFGGSNYTDATVRGIPALDSIRTILKQLGTRYLGRGDKLSITVLDVDLAGMDLSSMGPSRRRVLTGATPPRITLRYRLMRKGKVVASGEEALSDQMYLSRPGAGLSTDELRFEKEMLDDWFRKKFSADR
ncbi:MAG: DUF3016 domain-containing protein [Hyphomicrobiales bacterium]|nr:DUF3016 domain-containing protein [Alphaproteobacteria bacterium]